MSATAWQRALLEVRAGTDGARCVSIEGAAPRTLGSDPGADEPFPHDRAMSPWHAAFWIESGALYVRDLGSQRGTWVCERPVTTCALRDGDHVQVGGTLLRVRLDATTAIASEPAATFDSREAHVSSLLRASTGALFALVDAARDDDVLPFLHEHGVSFQSLYDGWRGQELALIAPYLASLPRDAPALDALIARAWGESWGIFLHAEMSLRDVRRQLRRSLRAELDDGTRALFRFYDPRVLRAYLPTCTADEAAQLYGPILDFVTEGRRGDTAMTFRRGPDGVAWDEVALTANEGG